MAPCEKLTNSIFPLLVFFLNCLKSFADLLSHSLADRQHCGPMALHLAIPFYANQSPASMSSSATSRRLKTDSRLFSILSKIKATWPSQGQPLSPLTFGRRPFRHLSQLATVIVDINFARHQTGNTLGRSLGRAEQAYCRSLERHHPHKQAFE